MNNRQGRRNKDDDDEAQRSTTCLTGSIRSLCMKVVTGCWIDGDTDGISPTCSAPSLSRATLPHCDGEDNSRSGNKTRPSHFSGARPRGPPVTDIIPLWPCLVSYLKSFHLSHRMFEHMHKILNIDNK